MNIEQNKELLGSEMSYSPKKTTKRHQVRIWKGLTKLAGTPLTNETITWENTKDEELNISHLSSWSFPPPFVWPRKAN